MTCAVLGAAGFIGSHLTKRLTDAGYEVRAVDIQHPDLPWRRPAWDRATERLISDLRDPVQARDAVAGADWVFHLAADVGGVGYLAAHDYRPFFNNMQMSMNVLDACEAEGVQRSFYASSSCVYPTDWQIKSLARSHGLTEDDIELGYPDLMYGREKLMTLRLCERAPWDARVGILNTVFGPGLKLEGERMKYPAAITVRAIRSVLRDEPLDIWGDGSQVRGYLHVADAVEKIMRIMHDPYDGPVNITSIEIASCNEVAKMVLELLGYPEIALNHIAGPTGPLYRWVSNEKWEKTYGPDPQRTMREAYTDFVAWVQEAL